MKRKAVLWIGKLCEGLMSTEKEAALAILARSWHSIYADSVLPDELIEEAQDSPSITPLTLRRISGDPDDSGRLASNRIPVYSIPDSDPIDDPMGYSARLKMFQQLPIQAVVFTLSIDPVIDLPTLQQALRTAGEVQEVVVLSKIAPDIELEAARSVHWDADITDLQSLLSGLAAPSDELAAAATVHVKTSIGLRSIDFSRAVDPSNPITERFEFIPATAVLSQIEPLEEHVMAVLSSPSAAWDPYASGVVYDRTMPYEKALRKAIKSVESSGPDATCTTWIEAQQASGISTMLRTLLFKFAREGIPTLIAQPDATSFDFQQLSSFFRAASAVADDAGCPLGETPWLIAFDAEHTTRCDDFVCGVANGLRKLNRHAVVLAIRPDVPSRDRAVHRAVGSERVLGPVMVNVLLKGEAIAFGQHLNRFLPTHQQRQPQEWSEFAIESERLTGDGKQSLFWLALRFWLLRLPGAGQTLRKWLSIQVRTTLLGEPDRIRAALFIAILSRHRLACPARLLLKAERRSIRPVVEDTAHPLGLRELWGQRRGSFAFAHPILAEELLRICATDSDLLNCAGVSQSAGLLDFELQLFEQLFPREQMSLSEVIPVIEELVTSALRVDPREAPQNYSARERIVLMLERVPDSVFDASPVFLHHLAKARRHVAADPPHSDYWSRTDARREQLDLAEAHIKEAITADHIEEEERREKPLNLHVSLALTYSVRADLEKESGNDEISEEFAEKAQGQYRRAQAFDPDNTYVLENFARLKLRSAREEDNEVVRLELLVDAVSLLEWELSVDTEKRREHAVLEVLASAYDLLDDGHGIEHLKDLAAGGSEAAAVAIARLGSRDSTEEGKNPSQEQLIEAIDVLRQVPSGMVTWRSRLLLYQLVSQRTPTAFADRLDPLDELESMADFPWPLQTRLEYGILLFQMGRRPDGQRVFKALRDVLATRSGPLRIPGELKFLTDPKKEFAVPLRSALRVTNATNVGRSYFGVPEGWGVVDIPFRPYLFGRKEIRRNDDLDCMIQFTTFGPQAVPPTEA